MGAARPQPGFLILEQAGGAAETEAGDAGGTLAAAVASPPRPPWT